MVSHGADRAQTTEPAVIGSEQGKFMHEETELASCNVIIRGSLDPNWAAYLGDLRITAQDGEGVTKLTFLFGQIPDFAAFAGLIERLQNLRLPILQISFLHLLSKHFE